MKLLICEDCRKILGFMGDDFVTDELLCRQCAVKKYGQSYIDSSESVAEIIEDYEDDIEDDDDKEIL